MATTVITAKKGNGKGNQPASQPKLVSVSADGNEHLTHINAVKAARHASAEFVTELTHEAEKKVEATRGALAVLVALRDAFPGLRLSPDSNVMMPKPDTENTDETPCDNPDKYKSIANDGSKINGSFTSDFVEGLDKVREWRKEIEAINLAINDPGNGRADLRGESTHTLACRRNTITARIAASKAL